MHKSLDVHTHGEGGLTDRTCQKWIAQFHAVDFLLDDAPWLGRSAEADSDQIN